MKALKAVAIITLLFPISCFSANADDSNLNKVCELSYSEMDSGGEIAYCADLHAEAYQKDMDVLNTKILETLKGIQGEEGVARFNKAQKTWGLLKEQMCDVRVGGRPESDWILSLCEEEYNKARYNELKSYYNDIK